MVSATSDVEHNANHLWPLASGTANVFGYKMDGVLMMSTCVLSLCAGIIPGWMAYLGVVLALLLPVAVDARKFYDDDQLVKEPPPMPLEDARFGYSWGGCMSIQSVSFQKCCQQAGVLSNFMPWMI